MTLLICRLAVFIGGHAVSLLRRDRASGINKPYQGITRDLITLAVSPGISALFALWLHGLLFDVKPF
ncbi:MAG: hypothetical protein CMI02_17590 [Oceanospirillaceae bacterium]|nr:hypothetical protein [Oceanospirillaceae bacterium]MBT13837.1 hypothetical protein [Oceanospirillaceae bacterium]|tara:strand:- start:50346 stop:50546 length:201 start_codon:yes stop_codon:yes gene_type:complete